MPLTIQAEVSAYFAARGLHEKGIAVLRRVHGKVSGYDCEAEYAVFVNTIEEERRARADDSQGNLTFAEVLRSYAACFKGVNFASPSAQPTIHRRYIADRF